MKNLKRKYSDVLDIGEEKNVSARQDFHIIEGVELTPIVVVQQHCYVVWRPGIDEYNIGRKGSTTRVDENEIASEWARAAICHLNTVI